jgi:hypothetical protein
MQSTKRLLLQHHARAPATWLLTAAMEEDSWLADATE